MKHTIRQKRYALLIAAALLLSNGLVTAHAFGEVDHAVKDGCQLLHQVERQQQAPASDVAQPVDSRRFAPPAGVTLAARISDPAICFRSRAPPFV